MASSPRLWAWIALYQAKTLGGRRGTYPKKEEEMEILIFGAGAIFGALVAIGAIVVTAIVVNGDR